LKNSTLIYCLDVLKIEKDTELYRKALELQKDADLLLTADPLSPFHV
jgi:hypothetical protein